jgi:hypothetical protein
MKKSQTKPKKPDANAADDKSSVDEYRSGIQLIRDALRYWLR